MGHYTTLHYTTLHYTTLLYSTLLYSTLLYSTLLYSTLPYPTLLYSTLLYSTLLYSTQCVCGNTPKKRRKNVGKTSEIAGKRQKYIKERWKYVINVGNMLKTFENWQKTPKIGAGAPSPRRLRPPM